MTAARRLVILLVALGLTLSPMCGCSVTLATVVSIQEHRQIQKSRMSPDSLSTISPGTAVEIAAEGRPIIRGKFLGYKPEGDRPDGDRRALVRTPWETIELRETDLLWVRVNPRVSRAGPAFFLGAAVDFGVFMSMVQAGMNSALR
jgi:hypothetical protein